MSPSASATAVALSPAALFSKEPPQSLSSFASANPIPAALPAPSVSPPPYTEEMRISYERQLAVSASQPVAVTDVREQAVAASVAPPPSNYYSVRGTFFAGQMQRMEDFFEASEPSHEPAIQLPAAPMPSAPVNEDDDSAIGTVEIESTKKKNKGKRPTLA